MMTNDTSAEPHVCEICDEPLGTESELTRTAVTSVSSTDRGSSVDRDGIDTGDERYRRADATG